MNANTVRQNDFSSLDGLDTNFIERHANTISLL